MYGECNLSNSVITNKKTKDNVQSRLRFRGLNDANNNVSASSALGLTKPANTVRTRTYNSHYLITYIIIYATTFKPYFVVRRVGYTCLIFHTKIQKY